VKLIPRPQDDPDRRRPNITAARRLLRWEPSTPLDVGLRLTINWFRQQLDLVTAQRVPDLADAVVRP
jgi:nucleoside-diphosphate-sugar epimerase